MLKLISTSPGSDTYTRAIRIMLDTHLMRQVPDEELRPLLPHLEVALKGLVEIVMRLDDSDV